MGLWYEGPKCRFFNNLYEGQLEVSEGHDIVSNPVYNLG